MGRRTLVDDLVDGLLTEILDGKLLPHNPIPPEADIAKAYGVSRLTVREALKALRAQNILYVKAGRGTFVNPTDNWTGLDAIFKAASHGNAADQVSVGLIEMRRKAAGALDDMANAVAQDSPFTGPPANDLADPSILASVRYGEYARNTVAAHHDLQKRVIALQATD